MREVPVEGELAGLAAVKVRRFAYSEEGFRSSTSRKGRDYQRIQSPSGNWSLEPVAIGAAEVTKRPKPYKRAARRVPVSLVAWVSEAQPTDMPFPDAGVTLR